MTKGAKAELQRQVDAWWRQLPQEETGVIVVRPILSEVISGEDARWFLEGLSHGLYEVQGQYIPSLLH